MAKKSHYFGAGGYLNGGFSPSASLVWDSVPADTAEITIPDSGDFSFTDGAGNDEPFSIFARIYMRDSAAFRIFSKFLGSPGEREYAFFTTSSSSKLQLALYDSLDRALSKVSAFDIIADEDELISVCCTYDGSNLEGGIKIYKDGLPMIITSASSGGYAGMADTTTIARIGRVNGFTPTSADGQFRDVRVIDGELSAAQVLVLHLTDSSAIAEVGHWPLNGNADDISGNGHHGTNVNGNFLPPE